MAAKRAPRKRAAPAGGKKAPRRRRAATAKGRATAAVTGERAPLSIRGYAAYRASKGLPGGTAWAVQKALRDGRLPGAKKDARGNWQIDPEVADREWLENTDPTRAESANGADTLAAARLLKEQYNAKLAQIEYETKAGKLIDAETASREQFAVFRALRDRLLKIPDRIEGEIVGLDPREAGELLRAELRTALEEVASVDDV